MGVPLLAFYEIANFWYDEETGNVFLNISKSVDVSYPVDPEYGEASDYYEAQIYLDGGLSLIGKKRPRSLDGTVSGGTYGKISSSPDASDFLPLADAPE
ncbi:hypothetical protein SEA_BILLNYE_141 [Streptomyces phage BillNye]|uniref:Uncharacterized protein n=2 Tax=Wilnyevirus billnye TaxID=2560486 RepID=A0A2L1IVX4_9CAUD|nr:hypothetical protein FDJ30_gp115 [Streptomyces phage BillNye]AVD99318.1 hypothetical protein SEA_BILLNYE_141 [Streptomyces phage BillNye]QBZ72401.1 hypothetical protein SEA_CIRCINUS_142 [Streptomyces phage Circinus]